MVQATVLCATGVLVLASGAAAERTVFVTNDGNNTITGYRIAATGALVARPESPLPTGAGPTGVAVTPDARHAHAANFADDEISGYSIAPDGSLSELPGSPFPSDGDGPNAIAITPDGGHLLTSNRAAG